MRLFGHPPSFPLRRVFAILAREARGDAGQEPSQVDEPEDDTDERELSTRQPEDHPSFLALPGRAGVLPCGGLCFHVRVLHVKTDGAVEHLQPAELVVRAGSTPLADAEVALRPGGPFRRLVGALRQDGYIRDELARGIAIPSLRHHGRVRLGLAVATLAPALGILELDRRRLVHEPGGISHLAIDLLLVAFAGFELSRPTPRAPGIAALALIALALRGAYAAASVCGRGVHVVVYAAAAIAIGAALMLLARVPSPERVALELGSKLGIDRSTLLAEDRTPAPPSALATAAVLCTAALATSLVVLRTRGAGPMLQTLVLVAFAGLASWLARRAPPRGSRAPLGRRVVPAIFTGLAVTVAAVTAMQLFLDTGTEIARCARRLDAHTLSAAAKASTELARALPAVRAAPELFVLTALVVPLAEERIYRGLLLDVLVRRHGRGPALLATSLAFGLGHVVIYPVPLHETVILGLGVGLAYLEGGLVAASVVHAAWNLVQLTS